MTVRSGSHTEELDLKTADTRSVSVPGKSAKAMTSQRSRSVTPSVAAPAGLPPTAPPDFTPPPPPKNLIRKMGTHPNKRTRPASRASQSNGGSAISATSSSPASSSEPNSASTPPADMPSEIDGLTVPSAPPSYIPAPPSGVPPTSPNYNP